VITWKIKLQNENRINRDVHELTPTVNLFRLIIQKRRHLEFLFFIFKYYSRSFLSFLSLSFAYKSYEIETTAFYIHSYICILRIFLLLLLLSFAFDSLYICALINRHLYVFETELYSFEC